MGTPIQVFRMVAPEFSAIDDTTVTEWIDLTLPLVSRKRFNKLHSQAVALLTAHRMKMAGVGIGENDPLDNLNNIGIGNLIRVANFSEGETSIGFNQNIGQYTDTDAELALTPYGIQYLSLRRMRIMSITSAGERNGGTR